MKIKRIISIIIILAMTSTAINIVNADTSFDVTAPELKVFLIHEANMIDADGIMNIDFDLIEEGSGVNQIDITFVHREKNQITSLRYQVTAENDNELLFTGKHQISFDLVGAKSYFMKGQYSVERVTISDVTGNVVCYQSSDNKIQEFTTGIDVSNSNIKDRSGPVVKSIEFANPHNLQCDTYSRAKVNIEEITGVHKLQLKYKNSNNQELVLEAKDIEDYRTGVYNIDFYIHTSDILSKGVYHLDRIETEDVFGNRNVQSEIFDKNKFSTEIYISKLPTDGKEGISVDKVEVEKKSIITPNALTLKMQLNPGSEGIDGVNLSIVNENGNKKALYWESTEPIRTKEVVLKFPINTYLENGSYHIEQITVYNKNFTETYRDLSLNNILQDNYSIEIKSRYDIIYYGSTANINGVIKALEKMNPGEVAIAEYSIKSIADKKIFEALAGKDITLVFEGPDVQWVFNGKDIIPEKCKSIDLSITMTSTTGKKLGYADNDDMLSIGFANNGELPGKAKIRLSNEYLKAKYGYKKDLVLSYYDITPEILSKNIACSNDGYAEIEITHNSTYILSDKAPRLAAPGNFMVKGNNTKGNTLSWNKVFGATGYKVYRAEGNASTYKLLKSIKGNNYISITYNDTDIVPGQIYYYRVCADGKNVQAVFSARKSIRTVPGKATLEVKSKRKNKVKIKLQTSDNVKNFVVYISGNGKKYKKLTNVSGKQICTINTKKYKKKCHIKVRAYVKYGGKKYYGKYSKAKKIKK